MPNIIGFNLANGTDYVSILLKLVSSIVMEYSMIQFNNVAP